jgi:hypothetical protein
MFPVVAEKPNRFPVKVNSTVLKQVSQSVFNVEINKNTNDFMDSPSLKSNYVLKKIIVKDNCIIDTGPI